MVMIGAKIDSSNAPPPEILPHSMHATCPFLHWCNHVNVGPRSVPDLTGVFGDNSATERSKVFASRHGVYKARRRGLRGENQCHHAESQSGGNTVGG